MFIQAANLLFFHPPKTGGTSFERMLGYQGRSAEYARKVAAAEFVINYKHAFPDEMKKMLGDEPYKLARKAVTVRHPISRAVSLYKHFIRHGWVDAGVGFQEFWKRAYEDRLVSDRKHWWIMAPQSLWIPPNARLIHLETFDADIAMLCYHFNIEPPEILHKNPALDTRAEEEFPVDKVLDLLHDMYTQDFELLG